MPKLLRKILGLLLLITTIGLATCQSMSKAEPSAGQTYSAQLHFTLPH